MYKKIFLSVSVFILISIIATGVYLARENTHSFTIETEVLPYLPPHMHGQGASSFNTAHHFFLRSPTVYTPKDMWVRGMRFSLNGASDTALHHAEFTRRDMRHALCSENHGRDLLVVGEDQMYAPFVTFPEGYGVFIPLGTPLHLTAMTHNPMPPLGHGKEYHNVSGEITLTLAKENEVLRPIEFYALHLAEMPCVGTAQGFTFTVPAQTDSFTFGHTLPQESDLASSLTFSEAGSIIFMAGHIHGWEGGKYVDVYKNGEHLSRFETKKAENDPYRFDTPFEYSAIPIEKGDTLAITATYTNPHNMPVSGAMGMLGIFFAPER